VTPKMQPDQNQSGRERRTALLPPLRSEYQMHRLSLDSPPDLQLNNVSFTFYLDKDGTTRIADAHLADTIRGSCPKCGKQNKLFWFVWDNEVRGCLDEQGEEMSSVTRRYFSAVPAACGTIQTWGSGMTTGILAKATSSLSGIAMPKGITRRTERSL